ncbi:sulfatase-like hydrolase/transferase [Desulfosarcina sp.]|nr:sulfatase-like hydrolase/transferase [Desulfosarcina sp.]
MRVLKTIILISLTVTGINFSFAQSQDEDIRPNIVIILADDMGYSDIGSFGSEINTPNMDAIANEGVRFTQFYTHGSCSPTRSMLLSGTDTHVNGLGNMSEWTAPNQVGVPGYEGYLNNNVTTIPQLLKNAGYHTYMTGKWHMGKAPESIPRARGFERDFSLLDGGGNYWGMENVVALSPRLVFTEDGQYLTELPKDYYATKTYTDKMIEYIEEDRKDGKPFFAYVAHQAPHDPYHLPRDWRDRHVGEYDKGWDIIRNERLQRQKELGIVDKDTKLAEKMWFIPNASQLAPAVRASLGMKMEMYAGMVENMDYHIGRLVEYLKSVGEYENTVFIVFGDNGAEGADLFKMIAGTPGTLNYLNAAINWSQTHPKSWGDPGSFIGYGPMWAQVSMTPFSQYKGWMAEGGIRNALIVSGPGVERSDGSINSEAVMHVSDIMPTLLDIAQTEYPETIGDNKLPPLIGKSWSQMLANETNTVRTNKDFMAWQLFGNRAVRQGDWKLRWLWKPYGKGEWELFNLISDPAERHDLAISKPDKLTTMLKLWDEYVATNNVILPSRSVFEGLENDMPLRFPDDAGYPPLIYKKQFVPPANMIKKQQK